MRFIYCNTGSPQPPAPSVLLHFLAADLEGRCRRGSCHDQDGAPLLAMGCAVSGQHITSAPCPHHRADLAAVRMPPGPGDSSNRLQAVCPPRYSHGCRIVRRHRMQASSWRRRSEGCLLSFALSLFVLWGFLVSFHLRSTGGSLAFSSLRHPRSGSMFPDCLFPQSPPLPSHVGLPLLSIRCHSLPPISPSAPTRAVRSPSPPPFTPTSTCHDPLLPPESLHPGPSDGAGALPALTASQCPALEHVPGALQVLRLPRIPAQDQGEGRCNLRRLLETMRDLHFCATAISGATEATRLCQRYPLAVSVPKGTCRVSPNPVSGCGLD